MSTAKPATVAGSVEEKRLAERGSFLSAQNAKAHAVRMRELARTNPSVRELVDEHAALSESCKLLNEKHASLKEAHESLAGEASRLQEDNIALRQKLDAAEGRAHLLAKELEASETTRAELARTGEDLRAQLAAALKPKASRG